jgi:hypothetical protein
MELSASFTRALCTTLDRRYADRVRVAWLTLTAYAVGHQVRAPGDPSDDAASAWAVMALHRPLHAELRCQRHQHFSGELSMSGRN